MSSSKHHVLIVGGGFGGVKAALELQKRDDIEVTLMSEHDDFRYYPTFYHTATGGLKSQSSIPLEQIINKRIKFIKAKAARLDRDNKVVVTEDNQRFGYDSLILALGVVTNYFGIKGLEEHAYSIKSIEAIQKFKQHLHQQLTDQRKPDLNYVIIGAGPTGIELAGALPAYLRTLMERHGIKRRKIHIDLVEAAPRLLPRSNKAVSRAVRRRLRKLGVHLYLNQKVEAETADALMVNGKPIKSHTVVWTAGVTNNPFFKDNGFTIADRGKVMVGEYLQADKHIYVIGDNASTQYSGLAQTALTDAEFVTENIKRYLDHKDLLQYKPKRPISVIPAGANWAAVEWGRVHFSGLLGWWLRWAADWVGFHDLQPWWKASEQWFTEFGSQEECLTCATANANE